MINEMHAACMAANAYDVLKVSEIDALLTHFDQEFGGYGTEAITLGGEVYPAILYVNMGDPYTLTICYIVAERTFCVAAWGTLLEEFEGA